MSGVAEYDELFGGIKSFGRVKAVMAKAKRMYGDYTPEANPNPFRYDKEKQKDGKYSEHIQDKIGDENIIIKYRRPKLSAEEKEERRVDAERLNPSNWGIDKDDLVYDERTNRSYFKVDGLDGYVAFPPIKAKDINGEEYYVLAHYRENPADSENKGTHYDGLLLPKDSGYEGRYDISKGLAQKLRENEELLEQRVKIGNERYTLSRNIGKDGQHKRERDINGDNYDSYKGRDYKEVQKDYQSASAEELKRLLETFYDATTTSFWNVGYKQYRLSDKSRKWLLNTIREYIDDNYNHYNDWVADNVEWKKFEKELKEERKRKKEEYEEEQKRHYG